MTNILIKIQTYWVFSIDLDSKVGWAGEFLKTRSGVQLQNTFELILVLMRSTPILTFEIPFMLQSSRVLQIYNIVFSLMKFFSTTELSVDFNVHLLLPFVVTIDYSNALFVDLWMKERAL